MNDWRVRMRWNDVCFLHWRVPADVLRPTLPPGLELDLYDGDAWISVVPFVMTDVRQRGLPALPGFGRVLEINVRTYVRAGGLDAVWFYSLDAASPLTVEGARVVMALPYFHAEIAATQHAGTFAYRSRRRDRRAPAGAFEARWQIAGEASTVPAGSLDAFLHERYRLMTARGERLSVAGVEHAAWTLHAIDVTIVENTLAWIPELTLASQPDRATFAPGVEVRAGALRPIPQTVA